MHICIYYFFFQNQRFQTLFFFLLHPKYKRNKAKTALNLRKKISEQSFKFYLHYCSNNIL